MATVAELAARRYQEVGYLLVIEGWPIAFTNRVELAGSGASSWIGDDTGIGEGRTVALGLEMPDKIPLGIGLIDSGLPVDDNATFTLVDRDDHLIAFAEDEDGDAVAERLAPSTDPAPATLIDMSGTGVNLHGRHINGEAIGASGERRLYQILPGNPLPGRDHASINTAVGDAGLRASTIQDEARWMEGRACALYLIRKDIDAGIWPAWEDQYESGYSLIWWGTVKGVPKTQAGAWTIECEGPSSWLRKTLNANRPAEWRHMETPLSFGPNEQYMAIGLGFLPSHTDPAEMGAVSAYTASDVLTDNVTPTALAFQIHSRIQTLAGTAGADHTFNAYLNAAVTFDDPMVTIRLDNNNASPTGTTFAAVCQLRMHAKAWHHLGWDLFVQNAQGTCDSEYEIEVETNPDKFVPLAGTAADTVQDPAPGYMGVRFTTRPVGWDVSVNPTAGDNDGDERVYRPYIQQQGGGQAAISILQPEAQQTWEVGYTDDAPYLEGQLAKPPADVEISSGVCDAMGFFAVRGSRATEVDGEVETVYQLARVSWLDGGTYVGIDPSTSAGVVWAEEWLDVAQWGSKSEKLKAAWAANDLECVPVAVLGYNLGGGQNPGGFIQAPVTNFDHAHRVLLRLLLSTGTASWSGVGDTATLTFGDNAPAGWSDKGNDAEIADLGLGIPADLIDHESFAAAASALPDGTDGALNRTRLAYIGPFDSQQTIEDIIRPRGWCFSLAGGRYGLFARNAPIDIEDAVVEITEADVAANPDEGPPAESIDFRPLEPVDLVEVSYGQSQIGGEGRDATYTVQARDPRALQRRGNATVSIDGRSLLADGSWRANFAQLWGVDLATWFGEPHATVTVSVKGDVAKDIWPGSVVTYTSPWPATRNGVYGMDRRVGRVTKIELDTLTLARRLEILVEGKDPLGQPRFAPVARLVDDHANNTDRHDDNLRTLYCYDDAFGRGSDVTDVAALVEPAWSDAGGSLKVDVWQSWDGVTWTNDADFTVVSVNTSNSSIVYDNLNGTIWEKKYAVLVPAPYAEQQADEWPRELFGVVCDSDGTHNGTPGRKWLP